MKNLILLLLLASSAAHAELNWCLVNKSNPQGTSLSRGSTCFKTIDSCEKSNFVAPERYMCVQINLTN